MAKSDAAAHKKRQEHGLRRKYVLIHVTPTGYATMQTIRPRFGEVYDNLTDAKNAAMEVVLEFERMYGTDVCIEILGDVCIYELVSTDIRA